MGAEKEENLVMGHSIRWYSEQCDEAQAFPEFGVGVICSEEDCLHVKKGDWEQETGFRRQMAEETEYIRDYGLFMIYANWSYQKNRSVRKAEYANLRLVWASHLGGKRESYRVVGDHILTQTDIENHVPYEDATASMSWSIDIHFPEATNEERFGEAFRSFAYHRGIVKPYAVPYRCL
ncbi:MAG: FAD-dependent oxidoreductase, partial [Clostridia bacterium]|nr:FAD-dependent oxidoreductase [Clostridia bacterium]